ncbi:MAG: hypothetical protein OEN01_12815 [Candidatus Krumholzibacteria bacterium]|nr:hypothetical protein [Candidatus Krumholzibacteria bacterium]
MASRKTDKVIAHLLDGSLLKGSTHDFYPIRASFDLKTEDGEVHRVNIGELKALFFVKTLSGRNDYRERKGFFDKDVRGSKILVEFFDGEVIFGYSMTYSPKGHGFFMVPGDPDSNNLKVFVVHASTKRVKVKLAAGKRAPTKKTRSKKTRVRTRR